MRLHSGLVALLPVGLRQRHGAAPRFFPPATEFALNRLVADVCVIGGGPAGSSVACRLARLGYRVCVVERRGAARPAVAESIAPSIAPVLDTLGVLPDVEQAGFLRCEQTRLRWSSEDEILREGQAVVLIERGRFDCILLEAAARAGAILLCPARARRPVRAASRWIVSSDTNAGPIRIDAGFVVDATGKRSALPNSGVSTVAFCGRWRADGLPVVPEMRVEALEHAWFWGATLAGGSFAAVAFLDTCRCVGLGRRAREALYRELLGTSRLLKHCVHGRLVGEIGVRDATCRIDSDPVTTRSIKVGDRSVAMEPLSSQGVQAAIRSGVQASAVIHTILTGGDTDAAIEFYRNAQRETAVRHRRVAAELYASQALYDSSFWRERSRSAVLRQATPPVVASPSFDTRLRLSSDARMAEMPVIDGDIIRRRPALSHPSLDQPIAWLGGVALGPVLSIIGTGRPAAAILSDWSGYMSHASARKMLAWLMQYGILVGA